MHEHFEGLSKSFERLAYLISGSITLGGMVDILDRHSWIIGLIGMLITCLTNRYYKQKHLEWVMQNTSIHMGSDCERI